MRSSSKPEGMRKLGKNMLIFSIGSFASKMMGYFLIPFYTAILSNAEYGVYDIVVTTVNLVFPIFTLLITESTMRFALDKDSNCKKIFTLSFLTVCVGTLIAIAFSPLILLSNVYKEYYWFFVGYYLVYAVHTFCSQFVKGQEQTKRYAESGILGTAITLFLNILLMAVIKWGLVGYFLATIIGTLFSIVYLWIRCDLSQNFCRIEKRDVALFKEMLRYSIPIMPNALSWWISTSSDKYIISYFSGVAETGLYSIAYKIPSLMTVFTTIFFNAWQISAVEDFGSEKSKKLYSNVYSYFFASLVCIATLIITFIKVICKIIFLNEFYHAWKFVPLLIMAYVFHDLATFMGSVYTSSKKTKMLFYSTLVGATVNIILNMLIIPYLGALGGALTTFISYFIVWIIRYIDIKKVIKIENQCIRDRRCLVLLLINTLFITLDVKFSFLCAVFISIIIMSMQYKIIREILSKVIKIRK